MCSTPKNITKVREQFLRILRRLLGHINDYARMGVLFTEAFPNIDHINALEPDAEQERVIFTDKQMTVHDTATHVVRLGEQLSSQLSTNGRTFVSDGRRVMYYKNVLDPSHASDVLDPEKRFSGILRVIERMRQMIVFLGISGEYSPANEKFDLKNLLSNIDDQEVARPRERGWLLSQRFAHAFGVAGQSSQRSLFIGHSGKPEGDALERLLPAEEVERFFYDG
jgi:hypothetical protein